MYIPSFLLLLSALNSVGGDTLDPVTFQEEHGDNVDLLQSTVPDQRKPNDEVHKPAKLKKRKTYRIGSSKHKYEVFKSSSKKLTFVYYPKHAELQRKSGSNPRRRAVSGESTESVDIIMEMLTYVQGYLEEYKIPHTLRGGSLLGAVRQCSVMQWDHDSDMSIFRNKSDMQYLYQNATKHKFSKRVVGGGDKHKFKGAPGEEPVKLDIAFEGEDFCTFNKDHEYCGEPVPCALDHLLFKCTSAAQEYFVGHYGDEWLEPHPDDRSSWNTGVDPQVYSKEAKKRRDKCRARDSSLLLANDDGTVQNGRA